MKQQLSVMIPSSIQRIRCFMGTDGRFKVKPWAGVNETLDAFWALLVKQSNDDAFWQKLRSLLDVISDDLKLRLKSDGKAVDNEVLNSVRYDDLLAEIRTALSGADTGKGTFVKALHRLSVPAVSLLLLLGSTATLGCSDDNKKRFELGDTSSESDGPDTETESDTESDGPGTETESDTESESETELGDGGAEARTLEEIVREVISGESEQRSMLDCISGLHDSWHDGLEELFQNETDSEIREQLRCLVEGPNDFCKDPAAAGEYDLDTLLNNCMVSLYIGVRFE